jgi:hypothetical protein
MKHFARYAGTLLAVFGLVLCALSGCSRLRNEYDILPNTDKARDALDKALAAWKAGQKVGTIQVDSQKIEVLERVWQSGKKLAAYEIVKAEDKPGPRWFTVKLTLQGSAPQQVNYAVLGIDPLWVYREEDYNQMCGMANK